MCACACAGSLSLFPPCTTLNDWKRRLSKPGSSWKLHMNKTSKMTTRSEAHENAYLYSVRPRLRSAHTFLCSRCHPAQMALKRSKMLVFWLFRGVGRNSLQLWPEQLPGPARRTGSTYSSIKHVRISWQLPQSICRQSCTFVHSNRCKQIPSSRISAMNAHRHTHTCCVKQRPHTVPLKYADRHTYVLFEASQDRTQRLLTGKPFLYINYLNYTDLLLSKSAVATLIIQFGRHWEQLLAMAHPPAAANVYMHMLWYMYCYCLFANVCMFKVLVVGTTCTQYNMQFHPGIETWNVCTWTSWGFALEAMMEYFSKHHARTHYVACMHALETMMEYSTHACILRVYIHNALPTLCTRRMLRYPYIHIRNTDT
jgi:hypothetical protein